MAPIRGFSQEWCRGKAQVEGCFETKGIDHAVAALVKADAENAAAIFAALAQFGAPLQGLTPVDFAEPGPFFRMGHEPVGVDILTAIPGVEFDDAWPRRLEHIVDPASGLRASFISREDLIAAKLAAGAGRSTLRMWTRSGRLNRAKGRRAQKNRGDCGRTAK